MHIPTTVTKFMKQITATKGELDKSTILFRVKHTTLNNCKRAAENILVRLNFIWATQITHLNKLYVKHYFHQDINMRIHVSLLISIFVSFE